MIIEAISFFFLDMVSINFHRKDHNGSFLPKT